MFWLLCDFAERNIVIWSVVFTYSAGGSLVLADESIEHELTEELGTSGALTAEYSRWKTKGCKKSLNDSGLPQEIFWKKLPNFNVCWKFATVPCH